MVLRGHDFWTTRAFILIENEKYLLHIVELENPFEAERNVLMNLYTSKHDVFETTDV